MQRKLLAPLAVLIVFTILIVGGAVYAKLRSGSATNVFAPNLPSASPDNNSTSSTQIATASPTMTTIVPSVSPTEVVQAYYNAYVACLHGGSASAACINNSKYTATSFQQTMAGKPGGTDPVICTTTVPPSVTVARESIMGNSAAAYAIITNGSSTPKQILVDLSSDTGAWKITDITCPRS